MQLAVSTEEKTAALSETAPVSLSVTLLTKLRGTGWLGLRRVVGCGWSGLRRGGGVRVVGFGGGVGWMWNVDRSGALN